jgi:hypothetical protein
MGLCPAGYGKERLPQELDSKNHAYYPWGGAYALTLMGKELHTLKLIRGLDKEFLCPQ